MRERQKSSSRKITLYSPAHGIAHGVIEGHGASEIDQNCTRRRDENCMSALISRIRTRWQRKQEREVEISLVK